MKDFVDRIPGDGKANRYKLTMENGGAVEYAVIERADEPSETGTPLNRESFMAVQGMQNGTTTISKSGNITNVEQSYADGGESIITITKNPTETVVVEKYTGQSGQIITKTTTITKSGETTNIQEVLS